MSWQIREILRQRRAAEQGAIPSGSGGTVSVCLVYPNSYSTAMSSLGFQTVYRLFNQQPGVVCERAFLPDRKELGLYQKSGLPLLSLENERPLADFDLIAFSISFEPDFINVPRILELSGIPSLSSERGNGHPQVIAGGAAFLINPEPVADFFDLILLGEGESMIPELSASLIRNIDKTKSQLLESLAELSGCYCPSEQYTRPVVRQLAPAGALPVCSELFTEQTEFGNMYLIEVSRGCPRGCRFCAAGFVYQPFRMHPLKVLQEQVDIGLQHRQTIGLVGAAVSDHPDIIPLCEYIVQQGGVPSLSSLRVDRLDPRLLELLAESGHRTVSLAPEGGSQRMRDLIRKNLSEVQILEAAEAVARAGILNMRLYFIIGLPGEDEDDLAELLELAMKIRQLVVDQARGHGRLGEITLSVNPFIPKPYTPLQWSGFCPPEELRHKVSWLEGRIRKIPNLRLKVEELQGCMLQALLSRGGRELTPLLLEMAKGANLKKAVRLTRLDLEAEITRTIPTDQPLVWNNAQQLNQDRLLQEYQRAMQILET